MSTFTVHQPPPRKGEAASAPERFLFVRDGFYFWAFLLAPLWLLWRKLWLALTVYLAVNVLVGIAAVLIDLPPVIEFAIGLLLALLVGFEAATIRRRKLNRRGWKMLGFVVGEDAETAERRFFAAWSERARVGPAAPPAKPPPQPVSAAPVRRGPPSPADVIGLFPEPRT